MTLRYAKIMLVFCVLAWAALSALGNAIDWAGARTSVAAVTSMATIGQEAPLSRATAHPVVVIGGALFIVTFKVAAALLCALGALEMWRVRAKDALAFNAAKRWALCGCAVAVIGLFFGWIVLGEQWWEMWRSAQLATAGDVAFRYGAFIALIGLMIGHSDE